jgi:hypothetical protein
VQFISASLQVVSIPVSLFVVIVRITPDSISESRTDFLAASAIVFESSMIFIFVVLGGGAGIEPAPGGLLGGAEDWGHGVIVRLYIFAVTDASDFYALFISLKADGSKGALAVQNLQREDAVIITNAASCQGGVGFDGFHFFDLVFCFCLGEPFPLMFLISHTFRFL